MKALIALVIFMTVTFTWTALEAADRAEASWKAHDAQLQAALRQAEGN